MLTIFRSIETRFFGPGARMGSRIKAIASDGTGKGPSVTVPYDHSMGTDENHRHAAAMLARKLGWSGIWVMGSAPRGIVAVLYEANSGGRKAKADQFVIMGE